MKTSGPSRVIHNGTEIIVFPVVGDDGNTRQYIGSIGSCETAFANRYHFRLTPKALIGVINVLFNGSDTSGQAVSEAYRQSA